MATNRYYKGPKSDHFDGTRFFNPGAGADENRSFIDILRWQITKQRASWPDGLPSAPTDRPPARVDDRDLRVSYVGHASFLVQTQGLNILIDPVWSRRASPLSVAGPERHVGPGIDWSDLPAIDLVLVSHNHYDHMDVATLAKLWTRDRPRIVAPLGNDVIINAAVPGAEVETGDWGDVVPLSNSVSIHFEPAHHWSARGVFDRRHALWCAFVVQTPAGGIYMVGDTGFGDGETFRTVAKRHPHLRLALLPIGAYEPRWFMRPHHINPAEAVEALRLCGAQTAIAHHWGTFQLTDEGYDDPPQALAAAVSAAKIEPERFRVLLPGQAVSL